MEYSESHNSENGQLHIAAQKSTFLQILVTILRIDLLHVGSTFLVEIEWILIFSDFLFSKKMVAIKRGGKWKNIHPG